MPIDISRDPMDIFADRLKETNPQLPVITKDDISIRRLTSRALKDWPMAVNIGTSNLTPTYGEVRVAPSVGWDTTSGRFILRKNLTFPGGDVNFRVIADNDCIVHIDGVQVLDAVTDYNIQSDDVLSGITAGVHDVAIVCPNGSGPGSIMFHFEQGGTAFGQSDATWPCLEISGEPIADYLKAEITETTVDVDLLIQPSEVYGDFTEIKYERVPINALFGELDRDAVANNVQVPYYDKSIGMLSGSINNFRDVFDNWYRFSHNGSNTYPANAGELDTWSYIDSLDCVESTINSGTYIGFISEQQVTDYEFNTVVSSVNGDDDAITILLAAHKQGDIDANEHTLSLSINTGGVGALITVRDNYLQSGGSLVRTLDPTTWPANSGHPWTPWYGHVYAKRVGDKITVWAKAEQIGTIPEGLTRDDVIQDIVDDVSLWDEDDFTANGYFTTVIDLATEVTKYNAPVRIGYGAYSQANARFWNISRPTDNPPVTPDLKGLMLSRYGLNIGDSGVGIADVGSGKYKMSFDNILYTGELEFIPVMTLASATDLFNTGHRFSHGSATEVQPFDSADLTNWTHDVANGTLEYTYTDNYAGIVTAASSEHYVFETSLSSYSPEPSSADVVAAFVIDGGGKEHTLSLCALPPEYPEDPDWAIYYNKGQSTEVILDTHGVDEEYEWPDVIARYVRVDRSGDLVKFKCWNEEGYPGSQWEIVIDINAHAPLAVFKGKPSSFGYAVKQLTGAAWKDIPV